MSAISREKVEALAKRGHVKCHGRGILGFRSAPGAKKGESNAAVLCTCVFRNLRRKGVNINDMAAVARFLAPDPPKEGAPCPTT
ncbi:MAG: hypothetical protein M0Z38_02585 [Deltaproteobacteria bacterium]|nr:hypothetical protein [Deltaproteobacteria bacterium]